MRKHRLFNQFSKINFNKHLFTPIQPLLKNIKWVSLITLQ